MIQFSLNDHSSKSGPQWKIVRPPNKLSGLALLLLILAGSAHLRLQRLYLCPFDDILRIEISIIKTFKSKKS